MCTSVGWVKHSEPGARKNEIVWMNVRWKWVNEEVGEMKLQWSVSLFPFLPTWYFNVSCTLTPLWYLYTTILVQSLISIITFVVIWPIIIISININSSPCDHGRGVCHYGTVENKCVTIILLENKNNDNYNNPVGIQMWSVHVISMMYDHRYFMKWTRKMFVFVNDCDGCKCDPRCDWWDDYRWEISLRTRLCKPSVEILFCLEHNFLWKNDFLKWYGLVSDLDLMVDLWIDAMIMMKLVTKMMKAKAMEDGRLVSYFYL